MIIRKHKNWSVDTDQLRLIVSIGRLTNKIYVLFINKNDITLTEIWHFHYLLKLFILKTYVLLLDL